MKLETAPVFEAFAPYRISPVGAHTDHQGGLCSGLTLSEGITFRGRATMDGSITVSSRDFAEVWSSSVQASPPLVGGWSAAVVGSWRAYAEGIRGALSACRSLTRGLHGELQGTLPCGGIASSAALQVVVLRALLAANGLELSDAEAMVLVRDSERAVTGAPVGLLDPGVILHGRARTLVVIDCAAATVRGHRFAARFPAHEWWLLDVGAPRELPATPYAQRVHECAQAARVLGVEGEAPTLGRVSVETLRRRRVQLSPLLIKRAEHVLSEIKRVRLAVNAVATGDLTAFAALMNASAESLVQLFEVGLPQSIAQLRAARAVPGVLAATFAGGGFGGHLLLLAHAGAEPALRRFASGAGCLLHQAHPS